MDLTLLEWQGPGTVSARYWVKNDATWLYILVRAEWPAGDTDAYDGAYIDYFWDGNGDVGGIMFDNSTWDLWWNGTGMEDDTTASPPGENNVQGAASHDGTYYWYEFRKELNSGDGYDWSWIPGQTIETGLLVGVWDQSTQKAYWRDVILQLSPLFADYPNLFIHEGKFNATVAIGANWERGPSAWPSAPAATIDVIGSTLIVGSFIPYASSFEANIVFDSECTSSSDWTSQYVEGLSGAASGNLIAIGGPGVNLVWRYYDGPDGGGYVTDLPAIFRYEQAGPYVYVRSTENEYRKSGEWWSGSAVTDYAIVELYYDTRYGRPVLLVAGISGIASRIAAEWLNDRTLDGTIREYDCSALILSVYDEDGDPFVTRGDQTVTVAESVTASQSTTLSMEGMRMNKHDAKCIPSAFFGWVGCSTLITFAYGKKRLPNKRSSFL